MWELLFGKKFSYVISDTNTHTSTTFYAIQAISDCVIESITTTRTDSVRGIGNLQTTVLSGTYINVPFSTIKLTSGVAIVYSETAIV